ncbi:MAG TPA: SGNH/GDSL hydrolase family protein [Bacteroidota bacterium]|jgi:hypothetical protein
MTLPSGIPLRRIDHLVIGALTVAAIYFYAGFFFPDPYILSYGTHTRKILWFIRICLPLLYAGTVMLYVQVRRQKVDRASVALLIVTALITLSVAYTVGDIYYQHWADNHHAQYHPYLQLMPADDSVSQERKPGALSVYCVGGSTTELADSSGVDWPSRVERELRTGYGMQHVEVYNRGRQWYTSLHTLINYETNLRRHRPSVVLYMESVNDLLQNADFSYFSHGRFREDYGHFYGPVNRVINRRSLWRYLGDVIPALWFARPRQALTTGIFPGAAAYARNIESLIELARNDSTRVVLMTEPCLLKPEMTEAELSAIWMIRVEAVNDTLAWSSETVLNGMRQYNDTVRAIAARNRVPLIDLERELPKSLTYFRDEVHYRDTAFPLIARFVAARLHEILVSP